MSKAPTKTISVKATAVDLFCGVGGMTHGLVKEGIPVAAGIDNDPSCRFAYEKNNAAKFILGDVRKLQASEIKRLYPEGHMKVLVGCAPCQPFSGYTAKMPKGDKWSLLYSFADLIEKVDPDVISMENVPGLLKFKNPPIFDEFTQRLKKLGYEVTHSVVFCPDYGIPQTRSRLVLFASKFGKVDIIPASRKKGNYKTVEETIKDLPEIAAGEVCPDDPLHRAAKLSDMNRRRIEATPAAGGWKNWDKDLILKCHKKKTGKSYSSVYGRMRWDAPAPTMTTLCTGIGNGRFGHPVQNRAITLREAALFQTFPKAYKFVDPSAKFSAKAIARQIGNAVPVTLGKVVAKSILKHLSQHNDNHR
jgi:DNA (cytosine-5)-methyltransferase 1